MELGTAMAFPFWWIGALTAGLFLTASFMLFGLALRLLNRATTEIRGSVLPGLVSGFRDWTETRAPARIGSIAGMSPASAPVIDEERPEAATATERLRRR
jgi:hypothetical protein